MNSELKSELDRKAEQIEAESGSPEFQNQIESTLDSVLDAKEYDDPAHYQREREMARLYLHQQITATNRRPSTAESIRRKLGDVLNQPNASLKELIGLPILLGIGWISGYGLTGNKGGGVLGAIAAFMAFNYWMEQARLEEFENGIPPECR